MACTDGITKITEERRRQIAKGFTPEHDDEHANGELIRAAYCYLRQVDAPMDRLSILWPWDEGSWKPEDAIANLTKAGALVAAEIDRLIRMGGGS